MTNTAVQGGMRASPLFAGVRDDTFQRLMSAADDKSFPPQCQLIEEGTPADFLHVVVEGLVELYGSARGRDATMAVVRPYETFMLAASVRHLPYLLSARTLQRSRIVTIPSVDVQAAIDGDSQFARNALNELAASFRGMVRHAKNLKLRSTRERIAAYLLRQSRLMGDAPEFTLPVEKRLIASYMGMTPENLSRALRSLGADGCRIEGQQVCITDRARLEALAELSLLFDGPDAEGAGARPEPAARAT